VEYDPLIKSQLASCNQLQGLMWCHVTRDFCGETLEVHRADRDGGKTWLMRRALPGYVVETAAPYADTAITASTNVAAAANRCVFSVSDTKRCGFSVSGTGRDAYHRQHERRHGCETVPFQGLEKL